MKLLHIFLMVGLLFGAGCTTYKTPDSINTKTSWINEREVIDENLPTVDATELRNNTFSLRVGSRLSDDSKIFNNSKTKFEGGIKNALETRLRKKLKNQCGMSEVNTGNSPDFSIDVNIEDAYYRLEKINGKDITYYGLGGGTDKTDVNRIRRKKITFDLAEKPLETEANCKLAITAKINGVPFNYENIINKQNFSEAFKSSSLLRNVTIKNKKQTSYINKRILSFSGMSTRITGPTGFAILLGPVGILAAPSKFEYHTLLRVYDESGDPTDFELEGLSQVHKHSKVMAQGGGEWEAIGSILAKSNSRHRKRNAMFTLIYDTSAGHFIYLIHDFNNKLIKEMVAQ